MAKAPGYELVMKYAATAAGTFTEVGWIASNSVSFETNVADTTTHDDTDSSGYLHRTGIPTIRDNTISGRGVFKTRSSPQNFLKAWRDNTTVHLQFIIPNLGTLQGEYYVESFSITGEQTDGVRAEMAFRNATAPTWTDATANF